MAFTTAAGSLTDLQKVGAGELYTTSPNSVEAASTFEDQLKIGRFAKMASGSLDNMDGSASPVIAGVVLRPVSNTYEDSTVVDTDIHNIAEFINRGMVLVAAKAGESPTWGDFVFASNAGDANDGLATVTNTDEPTGAVYLETVDTNLWRVLLGAKTDLSDIDATFITATELATALTDYYTQTAADAAIAAAVADYTLTADLASTAASKGASLIGIQDSAGYTARSTVELALGDVLRTANKVTILADPGDAGAIPVIQSGNCAITTADAETRTLAAPAIPGINMALSLDVDGGDCVVTVASAFNQTGNNTITMDDAGDFIALRSVQVGGAIVWRAVSNDGCTLSTV